MKISKKRLANKVRKLEVQNYDMRQKIKKMDKALTYLDELTTELNHALPDPEYDAKCEENAIVVEESLARHAVRLGLVKPELKQLDQSVFDGAHEMWKFAAVDADGALFRFAERPDLTDNYWANVNCSRFDRVSVAGIYDASNWKNSLIERENIAAELLEIDLELPSVCETCGAEKESKYG